MNSMSVFVHFKTKQEKKINQLFNFYIHKLVILSKQNLSK